MARSMAPLITALITALNAAVHCRVQGGAQSPDLDQQC
jgi:hypothetical protein